MPLRILLVGEPGPDRPGLEALLLREAFEIAGRAVNTAAASDLARRLQPDIAILDEVAGQDAAVAAVQDIVLACPIVKAIVVGAEAPPRRVVAAFEAGLHGYVARTRVAQDLVRAVRDVARGDVFLSPRASRAVVERYL